jgi:hypothetical protein
MKTYVYLRKYLVEFFLEWEMFQKNVGEGIKSFYVRAVYEITKDTDTHWECVIGKGIPIGPEQDSRAPGGWGSHNF